MELSTLIVNMPSLLTGLKLTLLLLLCSASLGLIVAACLCTLSFLNQPLKTVIDAYLFLLRGTPMLVQFYFIYYGLAELSCLRQTFLWKLVASPINCSILALTLNTSAYTTIILRGAFMGIPTGELDAARALGLSRSHIFLSITLPRTLSMILPLYSNEILMLLKGTSLASTITVLELTGVTEQLIGESYETITYWIIAGMLYLVISTFIIGLFKSAEYFCRKDT